MQEGVYTYCILDGCVSEDLGNIGLGGKPVYVVPYRDISALVSGMPFKQVEPKMEDIVAHNNVIEAARGQGTVIPIRFGVLFKKKEGVKNLLESSYQEFKRKISRFRAKDEFGLKIILEKDSRKRIGDLIRKESPEASKVAKEISESRSGTSYLLKLRLDEIIKNESLKRIEQITDKVHGELSKKSEDSRLSQAELEDVVLNAAYLITRRKAKEFDMAIGSLRKSYEGMGLRFYISGPWAPYSFC